MLVSQYAFIAAYPSQTVLSGTVLLQRAVPAGTAVFVESGRVVLGIAAPALVSEAGVAGQATKSMEHQLGVVIGPAWLEANASVLELPSAMDAVAETDVVLRRVPLADFKASLCGSSLVALAVLNDVARAHRQQARCAEWLLRHAESSDKGVCSVKLQQRKRLIAAQLGIAPETLSRVLRHLRERSLISGSGRVVNLVDPGGLRSLAGV